MDIGQSIKVMKAKTRATNKDIAEGLHVTEAWVSAISNDPRLGQRIIPELTAFFAARLKNRKNKLIASEFIAAGE